MEKTDDIQTSPLKGINLKFLITIGSIAAMVTASYLGIKSSIEFLRVATETRDEKIETKFDLEIRILKERISYMEMKYDEVKEESRKSKADIEFYHKKR